jgi:hypothetical protein
VRGAQAAAVLVAGDSLASGEWRAPQDMRALDARFDAVYDAVVSVLQEIN